MRGQIHQMAGIRRMKTIIQLLKSKCGATAVEMGLLCALIVLAILGAVQAFADEAIGIFGMIAEETANATNSSN